MFEIFGIISAFLLTFSSIPLAYRSVKYYREGLMPLLDLPKWFLRTWFLGSWGSAIYLISTYGLDPAIVVNYSVCTICATICNIVDVLEGD